MNFLYGTLTPQYNSNVFDSIVQFCEMCRRNHYLLKQFTFRFL
jgi:hypothetical protein